MNTEQILELIEVAHKAQVSKQYCFSNAIFAVLMNSPLCRREFHDGGSPEEGDWNYYSLCRLIVDGPNAQLDIPFPLLSAEGKEVFLRAVSREREQRNRSEDVAVAVNSGEFFTKIPKSLAIRASQRWLAPETAATVAVQLNELYRAWKLEPKKD